MKEVIHGDGPRLPKGWHSVVADNDDVLAGQMYITTLDVCNECFKIKEK